MHHNFRLFVILVLHLKWINEIWISKKSREKYVGKSMTSSPLSSVRIIVEEFLYLRPMWQLVLWLLIIQVYNTTSQKCGNRKWWLLILFAGLLIGGTVVFLSLYFTQTPVSSTTIAPTTSPSFATKTTNKPDVKGHVLMLSTYYSSNVPMVIGLDGESVLPFYSIIFYINIFLLS